MELAAQDEIERLTNSLERGNPKQATRPRFEALRRRTNAKLSTRTPEQAAAATPRAKGHYCKCGQCRVCLQNAEWETKFNLKFGESMKDYYGGMRLTRQQSWWSDL